jgi:hypothetical protein
MFTNKALRKIFGPNMTYVTGGWKNNIMKSLMICSSHKILLRIKSRLRRCVTCGAEENLIQNFCYLMENNLLKEQGIDGRIIPKLI